MDSGVITFWSLRGETRNTGGNWLAATRRM